MTFLLTHFTARQAHILELTRQLVERETTSREEHRLHEIAEFVANLLRELGGQLELFPQPGYGTHLRARFDLGHESQAQQILVIGHLDTVWPVGTLQRLPFQITAEGKAHGPGVFDMKASVANLIEALRAIISQGLQTK